MAADPLPIASPAPPARAGHRPRHAGCRPLAAGEVAPRCCISPRPRRPRTPAAPTLPTGPISRAGRQTRARHPCPARPPSCAATSPRSRRRPPASTIGRRASGSPYAPRRWVRHASTTRGGQGVCAASATRSAWQPRQDPGHRRSDRSHARRLPSDKLIGVRDQALLALGFAGAFRRVRAGGPRSGRSARGGGRAARAIRRSKTDQEGAGQEIAIPRGHHIRPVETLQAWLAAAGITEGPVFRQVTKDRPRVGGGAGRRRLREGDQAPRPPGRARSRRVQRPLLRAGFLTSASEHGASTFKMQEVSRHRSIDVLAGYVRRTDAFKGHAGSGFL